MIRYKLSEECRYLFDDKEGKIKTALTVKSGELIFVDLLEKMAAEGICETVKCRIYFPDGEVVEKFVVGFCIELHNTDELYDGRFNAVEKLK